MIRYKKGLVVVTAVVLSVGLLLLAAFFLQLSAQKQARSSSKQLDQYVESLRQAEARLDQIETPDSIRPGRIDATANYLQALDGLLSSMNISPFDSPPPVANPLRQSALSAYNRSLEDGGLAAAVIEAQSAVARSYGRLTYHANVMRSVRNLLEYEPRQDLASDDAELLTISIKAAGGGLERTLQNLQNETFPDDSEQTKLISYIRVLEDARAAYELALNSGQLKGTAFQTFVQAVDRTQQDIVANRQAFWLTIHALSADELAQAHQKLLPYRQTLSNIF